MKCLRACALGLAIALSGLAGCATTSGAIFGGYAGHAIGKDTTSTIGGAVLGGMIGHQIAK